MEKKINLSELFADVQDEQRVIKLYFALRKLCTEEKAARITKEVAAKLEELKGVALDYDFIRDGAARCTSVKVDNVFSLDDLNGKRYEAKRRIPSVVNVVYVLRDILQSIENAEAKTTFAAWLKGESDLSVLF